MEILELKNIVTKIQNSVDGLNIRTEEKEERVNELKDKTVNKGLGGGKKWYS